MTSTTLPPPSLYPPSPLTQPPRLRGLHCLKARPQARARMICFSHAGGDALGYTHWAEGLPSELELWAVLLPGKYSRANEAPFLSFAAAAEGVTGYILPLLDRPVVLFGHSLGALFAFEVSRRLQAAGAPPLHLFASGMTAPQLRVVSRPLNSLPQPELVEELRRLGGMTEDVLESPEILELILPAVRADFVLCDSYGYRPGEKLRCELSVFAGVDDRHRPAEVNAWTELCTGRTEVTWFEGGHFFIVSQRAAVLAAISRALRAPLTRLGL